MMLHIKNYRFRDEIFTWLLYEGGITPISRVQILNSDTVSVSHCNNSEIIKIGDKVSKITNNDWVMELTADPQIGDLSEEE